jgi:aspartyl protease family protein
VSAAHEEERPRARFVTDLTLPDGSIVAPSSALTKVWRVCNPGTTAWPEGVRLVSANLQQAVVEVNGRRETLSIGQSIAAQRSTAGRQQAILLSDGRGHFWANAEINGSTAKVLVDTGASLISMSNSTARQLGINFLQGQRGFTSTANGTVPVYRITLASVRIGEISLSNVDASVHEGDNLPVILLGMSFLNRVEMQRDGERMTLIRRF